MRHAFVPSTYSPGRCNVCWHSLDCAPHLPLAPTPTWVSPEIASRMHSWRETQHRAIASHAAADYPRAAVQGGR